MIFNLQVFISLSDLNIEDEEKADFDAFIDEILELVGPALIEEEIVLPDFEEEFEQGLLFVTLHGSAKVYCDLNHELPIEMLIYVVVSLHLVSPILALQWIIQCTGGYKTNWQFIFC